MEAERARSYAVWLLSQQARTEKEIREKLVKKECDEAVVESVMEALRRWGYLDDAGLAANWVASRGKTRGRRALEFELRRKGIEAETLKETMEVRTDEVEADACRTVAIRKVGTSPTDRSREAQAKLAAFLQRRGFGWDAIKPTLRALYTETEIEIDEE
jgi:regulatory protein